MINSLVQVYFSAYEVIENQRLNDTNVIAYEFRNLGNEFVNINNILLEPRGSANILNQQFTEQINFGEKTFGDYDVRFANDQGGQSEKRLLVIEKRYVRQ